MIYTVSTQGLWGLGLIGLRVQGRRIAQSVGATGGVYTEQARNRHELMTRAYEELLVEDQYMQ